jgi:hypothetical protein
MAVSLVAILILAIYPERLIHDRFGGLFTIFVGMLLLYAPLSALDMAIVPCNLDSTTIGGARVHKAYPWLLALLVAFGVLPFIGEASGGGGQGVPLARVAMVFAVFVGVGTVGIVIGYAFLRKPLGLLRQQTNWSPKRSNGYGA